MQQVFMQFPHFPSLFSISVWNKTYSLLKGVYNTEYTK